jgi:hypothetical protein
VRKRFECSICYATSSILRCHSNGGVFEPTLNSIVVKTKAKKMCSVLNANDLNSQRSIKMVIFLVIVHLPSCYFSALSNETSKSFFRTSWATISTYNARSHFTIHVQLLFASTLFFASIFIANEQERNDKRWWNMCLQITKKFRKIYRNGYGEMKYEFM